MRNQLLPLLALCFLMLGTPVETFAQRSKKKKKNEAPAEAEKKDKKENKDAIKPYEKVITDKAETDEGLFKVHKIKKDYFYEISDSLIGREMLMVSRIAKTTNGLGFGGGKINTQVLRWEKNENQVLLKVVSYENVAADSLEISEAVVNSNFEPILYAFDIKAYGKDSLNPSTVINVSDLFKKDVKALGLPSRYRERYKVIKLDGDRSYIETIKSYPLNIETRTVKSYSAKKPPSNEYLGMFSLEINNSMILLPKEPMKRRYFDRRVGWFARSQTDYGLEAQESREVTYLDRWRLEVKDEDIAKFEAGELVEPKKQIVYYVDRATPKKWVPYIKQGIEDWQIAFEAAGFKNAIIAKDPPSAEEDPEWSPEDVRYSVVRYLASPIPNANGPHVSDPRSGEILESDINWYHNVMTLLRNWYFIQTAAINEEAQGAEFKDEIMGRLVRFVSAHEVGHTIGLPHNMGSSVAYPVDSLRSKSFTQKYGTAPSIMDYARFNYVAQPRDEGVALMPNVGVYDKHAIKWGYRPILNTAAEDEKEILNEWILEHADDPMYRFGHQQAGGVVDPSSQTEDLGDDAVKASEYGIANLKRIVPNLQKWTTEEGENYDNLKTLYGQVRSQYRRYIGHVANNIGGVYEYHKTADQDGVVYTHVPKEKQRNAMKFLQQHVFATPKWLIDKDILAKTEYSGHVENIRALQEYGMRIVLNMGKMARLVENEALNGADAYTLTQMTRELRRGVWSEAYNGGVIDTYRRNLQKAHIERLGYLLTADDQKGVPYGGYRKATAVTLNQSDVRSVARAELNNIKNAINIGLGKIQHTMSRYHLIDASARIDELLDGE